MKTLSWVIMIWLFLLLLLTITFGVWILILKQPHPGIDCRKMSGWVWAKDCTHIEEKFPDPKLDDPSKLQLYLVKFSRADGAGPPVCLPMWYCFRYVNVKTGGYSPFSQWTHSPIRAGGDMLPCLDGPGKCDKNEVLQGKKSCVFNQPIIGVPDLQYNPLEATDDTFIFANVHRYTGKSKDTKPPGSPKTTDTEIIGYLIPTKSIKGIKYIWRDVLFNPCENTPPGCGRCRGC